MKFSYYNDTGREISIHPATIENGIKFEGAGVIKHGEVKDFTLPEETRPWVKMMDYGDRGLQILVMAASEKWRD